MTEELLYAADGTVTGVRHAWTFDDMFSAFATQGLEQKTKGTFTREELTPLAKVNVKSLKDYWVFHLRQGKRETEDGMRSPSRSTTGSATIQMTRSSRCISRLPFKKPVKAEALDIEVYDPEFFIDFGFAEKEPVRLVERARAMHRRDREAAR